MQNVNANPHDSNLPPSQLPTPVQWAGVGVFCLGIIITAIFGLTEHWRRATFVLGASMLWLAGLRLTCDSATLGVLAVRSRKFDAGFCTTIGGAMVFLALSVDSLGS